jgi:MoaA/NifB/PqqE/SkfB family radical SAM enzyme
MKLPTSLPEKHIDDVNTSLFALLQDALRIAFKRPRLAAYILRSMRREKKAEKIRERWRKKGIPVPPFMIASVTAQCNLRCKGCYHKALKRSHEKEMPAQRWATFISEARELGVSFILVGGGEPLLKKDLLKTMAACPEIVFPLFTNGFLIDDDVLAAFKKNANIVPMLSIEGYERETDVRRGGGIFSKVEKAMRSMKDTGVFFGASLTITRENFTVLTDPVFIEYVLSLGCSAILFVEYVPVKEGTEDLILSKGQVGSLRRFLDSFRKKYPAIFVGFPGDEDLFGGCLAAGRGFVHISPGGNVEPCPFSPYSDVNLSDRSLKDALQSGLLKTIRDNHAELKETEGGCALWEKREWVRSLTGNKECVR